MIASKSRDKKEEISMSTKGLTVWLILLTAWVGFNDISRYWNKQERNLNVLIRKQKFENIDANLKSLNTNLKSLEEFVNGPLRDKLDEIAKYSHKH
jgi:hypothetical protein